MALAREAAGGGRHTLQFSPPAPQRVFHEGRAPRARAGKSRVTRLSSAEPSRYDDACHPRATIANLSVRTIGARCENSELVAGRAEPGGKVGV